jgi:hypothetical protein
VSSIPSFFSLRGSISPKHRRAQRPFSPHALRPSRYGGRDYIHHQFQPGVWCLDALRLRWRRVLVPGVEPQLRTGHLAIGHSDGVVFLGGLGEPSARGPASPFPTDPAIFLDLTSHARPRPLPPPA